MRRGTRRKGLWRQASRLQEGAEAAGRVRLLRRVLLLLHALRCVLDDGLVHAPHALCLGLQLPPQLCGKRGQQQRLLEHEPVCTSRACTFEAGVGAEFPQTCGMAASRREAVCQDNRCASQPDMTADEPHLRT